MFCHKTHQLGFFLLFLCFLRASQAGPHGVLGCNLGDDRPSDTEDLVKDDASSSYSNDGAHVNPCLASPSSSENGPEAEPRVENRPDINFEDFECDVQLVESDSGEEKKEFSFTFYDLDGHGKITKDDVAGLVRSIYGAVNDTIKVPQGGKKTIKVRLTVAPENSATESQSELKFNIINNNFLQSLPMGANLSQPASEEGRPPTKVRNNVNVTIQENLHREKKAGKDKEFRRDKPKFHSVRIPNTALCKGCRNLSPEVARDCSASPLRNRKKWRERTCSFHRPALIDIIQENMEKNNITQCRHDHVHHHVPVNNATVHLPHEPGCPPSLFSNENFWKQKLADITENNRFVGKVHDCHNHKTSHGTQHSCKKHGHHRSRSHDLSQNLFKHQVHTERDHLVNSSQPCCNGNHINNVVNQHENCIEIQQHKQGCIYSQAQRNKNTNVTNSASPHQMKHRNREVEHARAMAQVISWLERENIGGKNSPKRRSHNPNNPCHESPPVVKKLEHHHHTHIHHHYHHYGKETPIIV